MLLVPEEAAAVVLLVPALSEPKRRVFVVRLRRKFGMKDILCVGVELRRRGVMRTMAARRIWVREGAIVTGGLYVGL
jgi:hypothetical protein